MIYLFCRLISGRSSMTEDEAYRKAKKRVEEIRGFYLALAAYLLVNAFLAVINYLFTPGFWWVLFVAFFWGIGIIVQAYRVFAKNRFLGEEWEERKIREIMEKEKK
ncbi:histidine kinase [Methanomicrobiaceae archaeon CYW5]|nr:histidine kinase [Methanovulcanius yangii]